MRRLLLTCLAVAWTAAVASAQTPSTPGQGAAKPASPAMQGAAPKPAAPAPAPAPAPAAGAKPNPSAPAPTAPAPNAQKPAAPAGQPAPAQPTTAPPPTAAPAQSAPPAPAQQPAPGTAPQAAAPAATAPQPEPYTYVPDGRRDPFTSLIGTGGSEVRTTGRRSDGPSGMSVADISVRGILQSRGALVAMVQGPDNKTYIVHPGDKLLDGTIKTITPQGLIVIQEVNDPLSLVKQREVSKLLRSLEVVKP